MAVVEGESATLVCGTGLSGYPFPNITWTDNNGRFVHILYLFNPTKPFREVVEGGRISLSCSKKKVSLTLEITTMEDSGDWNCSAQVYETDSLKFGQPVERNIHLVVVGKSTSEQ